ncbi:hypothetical protein B9057_15055 (plasmid) [Aestuarium zhoushanense]|nr:hypothetical protein B9057_15055 [Aestuarium zhoushanense]
MTHITSKPPILLSILIPTYNYRAGIERILEVLSPTCEDIEVIVFDDTPDSGIQSTIMGFADTIPLLTYRHNPTHVGAALGAGANWNALLDAASGEYVLLLHHDEVPLDRGFTNMLRNRLTIRSRADVYMLDLVLVNENLDPIRRHVPSWVRCWVPRRAPNYLFRRNVIGPTGTLIIRRDCAPRFDPDLRWLIDVDFYRRLIDRTSKWAVATDIRIASVQRNVGTITAHLSDHLTEIDTAERKVLAERYPKAKLWLQASLGARLLWIETLAWAVLKMGIWSTALLQKTRRRSFRIDYR